MLELSQTPKSANASSARDESSFTAPEPSQDVSPAQKLGGSFLILLCMLLTGIYLLDLITPVGVNDGMLYAAAIMLTPWLPQKKAPFIVAGIATILIIVGFRYSPGAEALYQAENYFVRYSIINRAISIALIWATALLTYQYRRGTEAGLELGSIVESSHDAIIGKTLDGKITSWNKGAEQMFGYTAEESIGRSITLLIPPARIHEEDEILAKLRQGKRIKNYETVRRRKDGREIPVSLMISPIIDRWGNRIGASKIAHDISQQKQVEGFLAMQTLSMAGHSAELKKSNTDLEQFAYIASHDLQEPLRTIHGFTQLLSERYTDRLDDQAREYIDFVTTGVERMQILIQDLLKYSRIQAQELKTVPINAEEILEEILHYLLRAIEEKGARITHEPLPVIHFDRGHFQHLLQNLITNALKFHGPHPPSIHISASEAPNHWQFAVRDKGIGIEPEYYEKVFLPFKRLHSRAEYQGTGIGLAISKKIVERRGGRIWIDSEVGKGTTIYFTLPKSHGAPA